MKTILFVLLISVSSISLADKNNPLAICVQESYIFIDTFKQYITSEKLAESKNSFKKSCECVYDNLEKSSKDMPDEVISDLLHDFIKMEKVKWQLDGMGPFDIKLYELSLKRKQTSQSMMFNAAISCDK